MKDRAERGPAGAPKRRGVRIGRAVLAFEQLRGSLYRYLLRRLNRGESAEDLAQEVYLRLLRVVDTRDVRHPQAYVYRIAANVLYEFRARERGSEVLFDSDVSDIAAENLPDEAALPDEAYDHAAQNHRLQRIVAQLPPMQRAVLRLAIQHDLSHAQIASKLGISVSTVRNHLYRAIDQCRHRIGAP